MENILTKVQVRLDNKNIASTVTTLHSALTKYDKLFSYLAYCKNEHYHVDVSISNIDDYNTFDKDELIGEIASDVCFKVPDKNGIIGHKQPDIILCVETFDPYIRKIARVQQEHWQHYEYEDLYQMCRTCVIELYRKGYYLNPKLINRTFINNILMELRKRPANIVQWSLYQPLPEMDNLTIADTLADDKYDDERAQEENIDSVMSCIDDLREILIDYIGPRGYEQLLREYGNHQTTSWSRKTMQQVKQYLRNKGYDKMLRDKYF